MSKQERVFPLFQTDKGHGDKRDRAEDDKESAKDLVGAGAAPSKDEEAKKQPNDQCRQAQDNQRRKPQYCQVSYFHEASRLA